MKSVLAISLGLVVVSGLLTTGGCVSKDDYDKLWAMNRQVNEELDKTKDRLRILEAKNKELMGMIEDRDRTIKLQADQIASLTAENKQLRDDLNALKGKQVAIPAPPQLTALPGPLNQKLKDWAEKHGYPYDPANGMVKFQADLTFDLGSATVKPGAADALKELAVILNDADAKEFNVYVVGHTDDVPLKKPGTIQEYKNNWGLSSWRAISVIKVLFDGGIDQTRMGAMGFSQYHPIVANAANRKGAEANRRVEIWIVPNTLLLTKPAPGVKGEGKEADKPAPAAEDDK